MSAYKPTVQNVDAGRYALQITSGPDGDMTIAVLYTTKEQGVRAVLYVAGRAEPTASGLLMTSIDPYDAMNNMGVTL